ncbi:helix-turn-helix domain-containing protein [Zongyangia sp. HA2173]|uniref:helix-turn-helix domain-containing protein n=1 Tax=Zongyangia sp. HA2173 TaxID=3133035 RepID=UPI00174CACE6
MFSENLKALRKQKGMTQEELASRLHVVRQTVSKWEQGRSVPDADLLVRLAEVLETTVAVLLGSPVEEPEDKDALAQALERLNETMAERNRRSRRIWKAVAIVLGIMALLILFQFVLGMVSYQSFSTSQDVTVENQPLL